MGAVDWLQALFEFYLKAIWVVESRMIGLRKGHEIWGRMLSLFNMTPWET